jgi:hypothetical protein
VTAPDTREDRAEGALARALESALNDAFDTERATSQGNAWNANSRLFVIQRVLTNPALSDLGWSVVPNCGRPWDEHAVHYPAVALRESPDGK